MGYGNGGGVPMTGGMALGQGITNLKYDNSQMAPSRQSEIATQIITLETHAERLHELMGQLESRISGVLSADAPAAGGAVGPSGSSVALASTLMAVNGRFEVALRQLQSILNRVEL